MMASEAVEATTPITITLQVQEWNQILGILSDAPFKLVATLINQVTQQAQQQAQQYTQQGTHTPLPNGEDSRMQ